MISPQSLFSCPPVCIRKPANSELSSKHRAPILHFDWCTQPHPSLVLQSLLQFDSRPTPFCNELQSISMIKPFGLQRTESNHMAGIAVFPTPARSPAMSSLPLAVERVGPVFHAHTDPWLALRLLCNLTVQQLQNAQVSTTPSVPNSPSICSHRPKTQTQTQTNTQPRQAYHNRIYNTSEALPGNLLGASRNHNFTIPSPPATSTSPDFLSSAGTCLQHRAAVGYLRPFAIYLSIVKPQCWPF